MGSQQQASPNPAFGAGFNPGSGMPPPGPTPGGKSGGGSMTRLPGKIIDQQVNRGQFPGSPSTQSIQEHIQGATSPIDFSQQPFTTRPPLIHPSAAHLFPRENQEGWKQFPQPASEPVGKSGQQRPVPGGAPAPGPAPAPGSPGGPPPGAAPAPGPAPAPAAPAPTGPQPIPGMPGGFTFPGDPPGTVRNRNGNIIRSLET